MFGVKIWHYFVAIKTLQISIQLLRKLLSFRSSENFVHSTVPLPVAILTGPCRGDQNFSVPVRHFLADRNGRAIATWQYGRLS